MALTIGKAKYLSVGGDQIQLRRVTFDGSYPSGGYPFAKAQLGLLFMDSVRCSIATTPAPSGAYMVRWDNQTTPSAPTLRVYAQTTVAGTLPEVTAATALTNYTCDVEIFGS